MGANCPPPSPSFAGIEAKLSRSKVLELILVPSGPPRILRTSYGPEQAAATITNAVSSEFFP